ncbi:uncharacterized protein LOC124998607 [Mugil cephalus]|uniref:uncharacterized protein LOC124998607 n=1 Tax=Mugil cephalus TaxID=48193 RepID=UPI001FB66834|nr:uncharacterized protein LOC124998607 [Mugil cephalus]
MGCSPSKGQLFSKQEDLETHVVQLTEALQDSPDSYPVEVEQNNRTSNDKISELSLPTEEHHSKETTCFPLSSNTMAVQNIEDTGKAEVNVTPQEIFNNVVQTDELKVEKQKKTKGSSTEKQRKSFNFPPELVRAHQAAYMFLNPNISRYETLLSLLDQASRTQLSLKPMMSALVLCFKELNQALEEMAEEGELMLKEHGDNIALYSGMGSRFVSSEPNTDTAKNPDPSPDLLLRMLQNSTEKMRGVGSAVQTVSDTALEEAVEYFSSLSKLLVERLQAKNTVEQRLTQVLTQIETAVMWKSNPEDCALHSEDSGIGAENESLTGSQRQNRHRGSAGSGSCGSGVNIHATFEHLPSNLSNLESHNEDNEEGKYNQEYENDKSDWAGRKRSNSLPPNLSQALCCMQNKKPRVKRPATAVTVTKSKHYSSTTCVNLMNELQKSQKDIDRRMNKKAEIQQNKDLGGSNYNLYRARLRQNSLNSSVGTYKSPLKTNQPLDFLPMIAPKPPKCHSVRRLINSFSQVLDARPEQSHVNVPPLTGKIKKSVNLLLSDAVNASERSLVINGNNNNSLSDMRDDLDMDNLPPPPPEVLMDKSFQRTDNSPVNVDGSQENSFPSLPIINQKTGITQSLKISMHKTDVPNRPNVRPRMVNFSPCCPVREDVDAEQQQDTNVDTEIDKTNSRYQQACKIIHLHNAVESPNKRAISEPGRKGPSCLQDRIDYKCESNEFNERETFSYGLSVTTPPVSRVRLPPSCPTVFRPLSIYKLPSRPSSPRAVPCPTHDNPIEITPFLCFQDARSVFCQNESQNSQACLSSRGRILTRERTSSTRRTQSEPKHGLSTHTEFSKHGSLEFTQTKENEPGVTKYRTAMIGDNAQKEPSAAVLTA